MGSDKRLIGKLYPPKLWQSAAEDLAGFAKATQDVHPAYSCQTPLLQPMAVVLATASLGVAQVVGDATLIGDSRRLSKLLHRAEDIRWQRPIRGGEAFEVRTHLDAIETSAAGETLQVVTCLHEPGSGAAAPWLVRAHSTLFIRERSRLRTRRQSSIETPPARPPVLREHQVAWRIPPNQAELYAQASGDHNPIHLDDTAAQKAGLARRVVHGLCTMSFVARAITEGLANDEPHRLRRLALRFARPVYPGEVLQLTAQLLAHGRIQFAARNQADIVVLEDGQAEIAPASISDHLT